MKAIPVLLLIFAVVAAFAWLSYLANMNRQHKKSGEFCPKCGARTVGLFNTVKTNKAEALAAVVPPEARELAIQVRCCIAENYPYLPVGPKSSYFCPKCRNWALSCDDSAMEGTHFSCKNPKCGFSFSVIN